MNVAAPAATDMSAYLKPGRYVDSDHPAVVGFARSHADATMAPRDIAVQLYYAVRDGFRYDPYQLDLSEDGLKASHVIAIGRGFCVPKAVLLAASARVLGVPARLGFADVRNHLTSKRLYEMMGTDLFLWHGYTELYVDSQWVKATPAFNRSLCDKACIHPLEFDGRGDSIFHEFDVSGRRHMEYVHEHGHFADVPRETLLESFAQHYPLFQQRGREAGQTDFEQDVRRQG